MDSIMFYNHFSHEWYQSSNDIVILQEPCDPSGWIVKLRKSNQCLQMAKQLLMYSFTFARYAWRNEARCGADIVEYVTKHTLALSLKIGQSQVCDKLTNLIHLYKNHDIVLLF